ncbi:hypothetical protein ACH4TX_13045 [Streptomyces sp. NPDC021098]|uniref:hypothetical protein n=1 Tax=unclassified Streptomyces TaxID=2593676 RepID=UPI0037B2EF11
MMTRGRQVRLTYVSDALCTWCHGFAPALRAFVDGLNTALAECLRRTSAVPSAPSAPSEGIPES